MPHLKLMLLFIFILASELSAQNVSCLQPDSSGHYLRNADGTPFFWLGDTAWELIHRLSKEEIITYLKTRKKQGFNVIQTVVLAEMDGLQTPNFYGNLPFTSLDSLIPNELYFELVDFVARECEKLKLTLALLPTWGDKVSKQWGIGPEIFNEENAKEYGRFLGERYKQYGHLVWMLGGDRPPVYEGRNFIPIWRAMALGITETYGPNAFITYHIMGYAKTSALLHEEKWLDKNTTQSGHGSGPDVDVWNWILADYLLQPAKPTIDLEPNYEDHPVKPWPKWDPANGYYTDYDVRKQCYRSVFAGAPGVTYGHHSIWQFASKKHEIINHAKMTWQKALHRSGANQMRYLRKFVEDFGANERMPAQDLVLQNDPLPSTKAVAMTDYYHKKLAIYTPISAPLSLDLSAFTKSDCRVSWYDPTTGKYSSKTNFKHTIAPSVFQCPPSKKHQDWVLILEWD